MRVPLIVAAVVCFAIAAIFIFAGSAAINPLGLIAVGLACCAASGIA
jgi:hypothetical protein